jgi:glycosyltransferase involved in cell wall biosynthesis
MDYIGETIGTPDCADFQRPASMPLVSCVMPTANRRAYAPVAIACFLRQTYENRELAILDDGTDSLENIVPDDERIIYLRDRKGRSLDKKRNMLCGLAHGEIICNWDDDDWYDPQRIAEQVMLLEESGKAVTGYHQFFYWDEISRKAYEYRYGGKGHYASGSSQCFFKEWWKSHHFPELPSEDSAFSFMASNAGQLISVYGGGMMVARAHAGSTQKHHFGLGSFPGAPSSALPQAFFKDCGISV